MTGSLTSIPLLKVHRAFDMYQSFLPFKAENRRAVCLHGTLLTLICRASTASWVLNEECSERGCADSFRLCLQFFGEHTQRWEFWTASLFLIEELNLQFSITKHRFNTPTAPRGASFPQLTNTRFLF